MMLFDKNLSDVDKYERRKKKKKYFSESVY